MTFEGLPRTMDALYAEAERLNTTPGWVKRENPIFWKEPKTDFVPCHWSYAEVRTVLEQANSVIPLEMAERRNLVLRNPFPGNNFETTRTAACAYQAILPGEAAPSHRHSAHALRVIIEATGTYSIVNGERTPMESGDVILTPGGYWHGHGHDGDDPAFWMDGLDIPLMHLLEPMFFEEHTAQFEAIEKVTRSSRFRFSADEIRRLLDQATRHPEGAHGPRVQLDTPDMPSMGLYVQRLESGVQTRRMRSTVNRVIVVMEGHGKTHTRSDDITWAPGDTLALPMWQAFTHQAHSDAVLFEYNDEPLMRFMRAYRERLD